MSLKYEPSSEPIHRFEGEMGSSKTKLMKDWDNAFRWTCCGAKVPAGVWGNSPARCLTTLD